MKKFFITLMVLSLLIPTMVMAADKLSFGDLLARLNPESNVKLAQMALSSTTSTIFTATTNTRVVNIFLVNTGGTARTVTIYAHGTTATNTVMAGVNIAANGSLAITSVGIALGNGETLSAKQDVGTDIIMSVYGQTGTSNIKLAQALANSTVADLFTASEDKTVQWIYFANTGSTARVMTIYAHGQASGNIILQNITVPANGSIGIEGISVLIPNGSTLAVKQGVGNDIAVTVYGR